MTYVFCHFLSCSHCLRCFLCLVLALSCSSFVLFLVFQSKELVPSLWWYSWCCFSVWVPCHFPTVQLVGLWSVMWYFHAVFTWFSRKTNNNQFDIRTNKLQKLSRILYLIINLIYDRIALKHFANFSILDNFVAVVMHMLKYLWTILAPTL